MGVSGGLSNLGTEITDLLRQSLQKANAIQRTRVPIVQRQHRLAKERFAELVDAYMTGTAIRDLAKQFGINRDTVYEWLRREGVHLNRLYASEWGERVRMRGGRGRSGQVMPPAWSSTRSR